MTEFYAFASGSPWLSFFLFWISVWGVVSIARFAINRPLRHINIWKHGYPPPHCDADGDFKDSV